MNIPQRWKDVLRAIQDGGFPEAIIAGGALRDLDHGVEVKDVDIFVKHRGDNTLAMINKAMGYPGFDMTQDGPEYHSDNPEVIAVYEFAHSGIVSNGGEYDFLTVKEAGPPFQIIACGDHGGDFMQHQLDRFDIGLCRVAFNGNHVEYTSPYCHDKAFKQLRIIRPWSLPRSVERARRIGRKFPGFNIVGPDGNEIAREESFDFPM